MDESIGFFVDGYNYNENIQNILGLTNIIWSAVSQVLIKNMNEFEIKRYKEEGLYMEQVSPDGNYAFETHGIMNFYLRGIPERMFGMVKDETLKVLKSYNVDSEMPYLEDSGMFDSKVLRFPVEISPTEIAPTMNLSNENARKLMTEFLGYPDFEYSDRISAAELIMKIGLAERKVSDADMGQNYTTIKPHIDKNIYQGQIGKEDITRYLENLKEIAEYSIQHGNGYVTIS